MKKSILSFVILISFSILSLSQTSVNYLSIQDAIAQAFEHNPQIQQSMEAIEIAKSERWKKLGIYTPSLSYMKEGIGIYPNGYLEKRISISQSIDFPLTSIYNFNSYSDEVTFWELKYENDRRQLISAVKSRYVDVLYFERLEELRDQQLELALELNDAVISRVEAGMSSELELIKTNIKLDESRNDLLESEQAAHQARYSLFELIGMSPDDQRYSIFFSDTLNYHEIEIEQDDVLMLINNQPDVLAYESKVEAADNKVAAATSSYLPNIDFSYYWQDFGKGYNFNGFEVGFSVPVWFMFNESRNVQIAQAEKNIASWQKQKTILKIKKDIEKTWHSFETARETITRYQNKIKRQSKELLDLTTEGYRMGNIDLLNLLDSQKTFLSSEQRYINALRNYYLRLIELEVYLEQEIVF